MLIKEEEYRTYGSLNFVRYFTSNPHKIKHFNKNSEIKDYYRKHWYSTNPTN